MELGLFRFNNKIKRSKLNFEIFALMNLIFNEECKTVDLKIV